MTNSEILNLFAQSNRNAAKTLRNDHYDIYADLLENEAVVQRAREILSEKIYE